MPSCDGRTDFTCHSFHSKPTDIEWRFTEKGKKVRVSVRTGRIIPLPSGAKELEDFVNPESYTGALAFSPVTWF